ncbi:unnamed protein product [Spirodela intermedia]|uniref:Uncharacterized protein n=1 Tax=Spirodela intermedia TaxID=51605 RepID=A0A7I8ITM2_SPIIN|nr:unnamed protein product [Spirodela intermedia]CAA6660477.1 unnamed protein product [Spirodela intermedia]
MASKNNFCHQKKEKQKINNVDNAREVNTHKRLIICSDRGRSPSSSSRRAPGRRRTLADPPR